MSATVTMFRAVPARFAEFREGDWVALDWAYCASHADGMADWTGEPWHVISRDVPAEHVVWAGERDEWFADSGEKREYFYRPGVPA